MEKTLPKRKSFHIGKLPVNNCEINIGSLSIHDGIGIGCRYREEPEIRVNAMHGEWNIKIRYFLNDWSKPNPEVTEILMKDSGYTYAMAILAQERIAGKFHDTAALILYHEDVDPVEIDWTSVKTEDYTIHVESADVAVFKLDHWNEIQEKDPFYDIMNGEKHGLYNHGLICSSSNSDGAYDCKVLLNEGIAVAFIIIFIEDAINHYPEVNIESEDFNQ